MIEPHGSLLCSESAGLTKVLSVTVRAVVSAESSTLIVSWLGGFWIVRVPRMPCTLPALPTLTVSPPPLVLSAVLTPVARTLTVSAPWPVVTDTLLVSRYS